MDGAAYYFCSPHCAATFDADPDRYTSTATRP
ncbi:MAG: YHS domain-containing protein [Betaproteobacteria bacterium]